MTEAWYERVPNDAHWLITGGTRKGKTGLLTLLARAYIRRGVDGLTLVDPHGACARSLAEWMANPAHGQLKRPVHVLDPCGEASFGVNPLNTFGDTSFKACHEAAVTLVSVVEAQFDASPEETPRLSRILYCASMLCARHGLSVLEILEVLSLGGNELRRSLLQDFEHQIVRRELEDLQELATRQPARFYEFVESTRSRFIRWASHPPIARILGHKQSLNPRALMDGRAIVLIDLADLSYEDATFIGALICASYFSAARHRPPLRAARHRLILDEAESLITLPVARMLDQTAKYGLNIVAAVQRLGQLRNRGDFIADALFANAGVKCTFGIAEPESARFLAEMFFTGHLDLTEWKPGTERAVATGNEKTTVRSSSVAEHEAEHRTHARTTSHSRGEAIGTMTSTTLATGEFSGSGDSSGLVMSPPATLFGPNAPNATMMPVPLSQSSGESSSRGSSSQSASSSGTSHVSVETYGEAETVGAGRSRGTSRSEGLSEVFVTKYETLPTQLYSLEEQLHRATGDIMNLPRRELFLKVEIARPIRTRTADLTPAFTSVMFKALMLPLFLRNAVARSPYLLPAPEVDAAIAARLANVLKPPSVPEPDLTAPEPLPVVDQPHQFAADFWAKRRPPHPDEEPPRPKPRRPKGRRPTELGPRHSRFEVFDGGAGDVDKKK